MAVELARFISSDEVCAYLDLERASLEYRIQVEVSPSELDSMLERGWRRFGAVYFRPACHRCRACIGLRIPVERFEKTNSQRRVEKRAAAFRREVGRPIVDAKRVELYGRWHADRESRRSWSPNPVDPQRYASDFCHPHQCAHEIAWYDGERLIGVDLVDITPSAVNTIFFFFDPDYLGHSLGIASVLHDIEWARELGREYVYLGYFVQGCRSMNYKAGFQPHQLLEGRPGMDETAVWRDG